MYTAWNSNKVLDNLCLELRPSDAMIFVFDESVGKLLLSFIVIYNCYK